MPKTTNNHAGNLNSGVEDLKKIEGNLRRVLMRMDSIGVHFPVEESKIKTTHGVNMLFIFVINITYLKRNAHYYLNILIVD